VGLRVGVGFWTRPKCLFLVPYVIGQIAILNVRRCCVLAGYVN